MVGQRLYVYARDLSARPFPSDGFCQLQIRPSRRTPGPLCLFFVWPHHTGHRYRWGYGDPTQAWQIGLDRTEEIIVGIICSLLVTTLLWPRYAREEFFEAGRAALKTVNQLFSAHARAYLEAAAISPEVENIHHAFWQQLSVLKNLQQAGARESTLFAARLSNYNAFLVALSDLFQAVLDLGRHRDEARFLDSMEPETASFLAAIREEFDFLSARGLRANLCGPAASMKPFGRLRQR